MVKTSSCANFQNLSFGYGGRAIVQKERSLVFCIQNDGHNRVRTPTTTNARHAVAHGIYNGIGFAVDFDTAGFLTGAGGPEADLLAVNGNCQAWVKLI